MFLALMFLRQSEWKCSSLTSARATRALLFQTLQYVLIPMFQISFDRGEGNDLIGGPPNPEQDSNENVISVFVSKVIDPENPFGTSVRKPRLCLLWC